MNGDREHDSFLKALLAQPHKHIQPDLIFFIEREDRMCLPEGLDKNPLTAQKVPKKGYTPVGKRVSYGTFMKALEERLETLERRRSVCAQCKVPLPEKHFRTMERGRVLGVCSMKCFDAFEIDE
jgi:hypothetical protein